VQEGDPTRIGKSHADSAEKKIVAIEALSMKRGGGSRIIKAGVLSNRGRGDSLGFKRAASKGRGRKGEKGAQALAQELPTHEQVEGYPR